MRTSGDTGRITTVQRPLRENRTRGPGVNVALMPEEGATPSSGTSISGASEPGTPASRLWLHCATRPCAISPREWSHCRMHITRLHLEQFKRFDKLDLELCPGMNILVGDNETGKSSVLEAIALVLTGQYEGRPLSLGY